MKLRERLFGISADTMCVFAVVCFLLPLNAPAADLYPGNGAAMSAESPDLPLPGASVLVSTPSLPGDASFVNTSAAAFNWTGPSTAAAAGLGADSFFALEVSDDADFGAGNIVVNISTPITVNTGQPTADGIYVSTVTLAHKATYYWRVRTVDGVSLSPGPWSQVYSFETDLIEPSAVSDLGSIGASTRSITLNWLAPGDDGAGGVLDNSAFIIQYSSDTGVVWSTSAAQINISTTSVNPGTSRSYTPGGLSANTSYYFRLWTKDDSGNYSAISNDAAAETLANTVTAAEVTNVSLPNITAAWLPLPVSPLIATCEGYLVQASTVSDFTGAILSSATSDAAAASLTVSGLDGLNTTFYFRVGSLNWAGTPDYTAVFTTTTLASQVTGAQITGVFISSVSVVWTPLPASPASSTCEGYLVQASTASDFSGNLYSSATLDSQLAALVVPDLPADATYYFRVGSLNWAGAANYAVIAGSTKTLTEVDPPTMANNETADYVWHSANTRVYDIDFADTGGSGLSKFQVKAATGPGETGIIAADWTDVVTDISSNSYTEDWPLTPGIWNLLVEGVTNYVSVRVYDGAANSSTTLDAFMVFKDTTPPARQGTVNDAAWLNSPTVYDVNFYDWTTKLKTIQYAAWTAPAQGGAQVLPWTDLAAVVDSTSYETDWSLAQSTWALLQSGTNYLALRAWDYAVPANTATWVDAFRVLKDTAPPAAAAGLYGAAVSTNICNAVFTAPAEAPSGIDLFALEYATYTVVWSTSSVDDAELNSTHVYVSTTGLVTGVRAVIPFDGLTPNTSYYLRVWSRDSAQNWSDVSNAASVSTLADKVSDSQLADVYFTSAAVTWTALPASPPGATSEGYLVQASTAADFTGALLSSSTADSQLSSVIVAGLLSEVAYYFRVGSLNWSGEPYYADTLYAMTHDNVPPAAVSALSGESLGGDTVKLTWPSPGDNGSAGTLTGGAYSIQYTSVSVSAADPLFWSTAAAQTVIPANGIVPASEQSYTVTGLGSGATYYFRSWTSDEAGNYSPVSNMTTVVIAPRPPSNARVFAVYSASITIAWDANGNIAGSLYQAEAATDDGFTLNPVSTITADTGYTFAGLLPNVSYYMHVRTLGGETLNSEFADLAVTPTLSVPVTEPQLAGVFADSVTLVWTDLVNPDGTKYRVSVSSDDFAGVYYSTDTGQAALTVYSLIPNSYYSFRAAALNWAGVESGYADFPSTHTFAGEPKLHPAATFSGLTESAVQVRWLPNSNPDNTEYLLHVSSSPDFLGKEYGTGNWSVWAALVSVAPLDARATYYFEVKARDALLRETAWLVLGSTKTLTGVDNIPPVVTDLQGGDDTWRGPESGYYKVHFYDVESDLSKFEVKLSSTPGQAGPPLADWTDVVTNINAHSYDTDWQLPASAFQAITEDVTAYVSVRVYDKAPAPNITVSTDVFYVIRDTTPPTIENGAVSPAGWQNSDPGPFNIDFSDARSGLAVIQYSAGSLAVAAGADQVGWTDIAALVSSKTYTADWRVDFAALASGATNYISVRAIDAAGNMTLLADAFKILKMVGGPGVAFASPAYVSTVTTLSGAAAGGNDGIAVNFVEVSVKELAGRKYYNGPAGIFDSDYPVWLRAAGSQTWSLDVSTFGFVNLSSYTVVARAKDSLGRYSLVYATSTFTVDQDAPTIAVSSPAAYATVYTLDAITGTAADTGSGPAQAGVSVQRVTDGKWWNFINREWNIVQASSFTAVTGGAWTFLPDVYLRGNMLSGYDYFVTAHAEDAAVPANHSAFGLAGSTFTFADTIAPGQTVQVSASTDPASVPPGRLRVSWIFPGEDGDSGLLKDGTFAVKYSTLTGFAYSTASAQVLISTASVLPGSTQVYIISGLANSTSYYLRLWTKDDAELWSAASPEFSGLSGAGLPNEIAGHVRTAPGQGITGVLAEAFNSPDLPAQWAYTIDDGSGSFSLSGLEAGVYRIQVTWLENGIASSVSKDGIPVGYADADFTLSVTCQLATVSGQLPTSRKTQVTGHKPEGSISYKSQVTSHKAEKATSNQLPVTGYRFEGGVELYQRGRLVAVSEPGADGRFTIANLLPGDYELRISGMAPLAVRLRSGENLTVYPTAELLTGDSFYAYPDPARRWVKFHFHTGDPSAAADISVFNVAGRLVKKIRSGDAGWSGTGAPYEYQWDFSNTEPAPGVYIYKLNIKSQTTGKTRVRTGKFAVIR